MPNTARTQIALAASPHFRSRLSAALAKIAWQIMDEAGSVQNHTARIVFARQVLANVDTYAAQIASHIVERTNVLSATTSYDFELGALGAVVTAATDAALESQLATDWDRLSGVNT
jgi:hypothetical protein